MQAKLFASLVGLPYNWQKNLIKARIREGILQGKNYEEAIYLSRICRKIAKKHNGDTSYAYDLFLKYHAHMMYEKNIMRNEYHDVYKYQPCGKYRKLDFYRWYNQTGIYE